MRVMDHPNVISLKHCFFSTTSTNELYLNLVMEYVPQSLYQVIMHYSNANQRMPLIQVKLYMYQVWLKSSDNLDNFFYLHIHFLIKICCGLADFQGFRLYPHCSRSMSQRFEASKYTGRLLYAYRMNIEFSFSLISNVILCILQVDSHTHQVKLCDFGSAKMLVCWPYCIVNQSNQFDSFWLIV